MKSVKDEYYFDRTIKFDNATVNIYRPVISKEENERRMKRINDAAVELLKEKLKNDKRRV